MRMQLADSTVLKDSISVVSELVTEGRFKFTRDSVELIAMDPANVAMVIFKLLASCFTEYDVPKEQEIGLNLANLKQILRRSKADDILALEVTADNKLQIQMRSNTTRTFSLPLINLDEKEQRIPTLTFPVTVTLPAHALNDAIEDVGIIAESVNFKVDQDKLIISAEGDLSKASIEIKSDDETIIKTDTKAEVKAKYSIEYLKKMMQAAKLADVVSIAFSQDYPLRLDYKVIDKLLLSFILAPRVEND